MESNPRKWNNLHATRKTTFRVAAIAVLVIVLTASMFALETKAYAPRGPQHDPPAVLPSAGPDDHYAVGTNRFTCMGCTGSQIYTPSAGSKS